MWQQLLMNGLIAGSTYGLVALGFSLIYSVGRFFHFAHAAVIICAGYSVLFLTADLHVPLSLSIILSIIVSTLIGMLMEIAIYRQLRKKNASSIMLLLASLGIYILVQNMISMKFGDEVQALSSYAPTSAIVILKSRITRLQAIIVLVNMLLYAIIGLLILRTRTGRIIRAVANDMELACVAGVNADHAMLLVFALGSALAAVAGILISYDTNLTPTMGFNALLMGVVAVVIGGIGSVRGAILGGLLVGLSQHLGVWKLPTQWQDAIVFTILILFLLLRPQGFLGKPLRRAAV